MKILAILLLCLQTYDLLAANRYTFIYDSRTTKPRGGTTVGPKVKFDTTVPTTWTSLQEESLTKFERDRRAILALQGEFEVSFEFIESFLIDTPKNFDVPYFSKATEFVKVIEDRGDFISLQHILVMYMVSKGKVLGPYVTKHWRQDWQWEGVQRFVFQGDKKWNVVPVDPNYSKGKWVWSVFQVDDSPRYTGLGTWGHTASASFFDTDTISRPLPRREFSVRNDYKLLMGRESIIVTKGHWYHEQKAFKHQSSLKNGQFNGTLLAREIGQNTYRRIKNFNWSAGIDYWNKTSQYWSDVRAAWRDLLKNDSITFKKKKEGPPLYLRHFIQSEDPEILKITSNERQKLITKTIREYLK